MEDLAHIEQLCNTVYMGGSPSDVALAQQKIIHMQSSADFIPKCQYILDNSSQPYAHLLASTSLESLMTQFWNNFTADEKLQIRNYVLNILATKSHNLEEFVIQSLCKLACRITKLGWFDSDSHRGIIEEVSKFLGSSMLHQLIGLRLLTSLVDEMNLPTTGRTLTLHRKTAVSFRDTSLLKVFQLAIDKLRNIEQSIHSVQGSADSQEHRICNFALSLATSCLSFDFIGTNPEESAEDVGTVQVPSQWRSIVQDLSTMNLFMNFYKSTVPPRSNQALECVVQLSSVRRSLFSSEKERTAFLENLMQNIRLILSTQQGIRESANYHQFCRLLGRLKACYQLSELVRTTGFSEFLETAKDFTIKSLENWRFSMNSIHYLLQLWGRLVAALPYLRAETEAQRQAQTLKVCVNQVVQCYIDTMLNSVDIIVMGDGSIEDPLEDEGSLREQMDRLPVIARLHYETIAQYLSQIFDQNLKHYRQGLDYPPSPVVNQQLLIIEGKMTWLTYMVAAVIGSQSPSDPRRKPAELLMDGCLSRCVFELVQLIDYRLNGTAGTGKCDDKLESAILNYFKSFKKVYLMESTGGSLGMLPGGSPAHPLLSLALSYAGSKSETKDSSEAKSVFDAMGIGDLSTVMNIIVNKLVCTYLISLYILYLCISYIFVYLISYLCISYRQIM
jgi:exportin-7